MKKISKIKKYHNKYLILLSDGSSLSFCDEVIIKYNLFKPQVISDEGWNKIIDDNNFYELYNKVLKDITKRLKTKKELLTKYHDNKYIKEVLDKLISQGYLSDCLYISSYINEEINLSLKGPNKIRKELLDKGFSDDAINSYLDTFKSDFWLDRIKKVVNKGKYKNESKYSYLNKMKKYLYNLGYSNEDISIVLSNIDIANNNGLDEAFKKEYRRLKHKLNGVELEKKIRYNLYRKGYQNIDVKELINELGDDR